MTAVYEALELAQTWTPDTNEDVANRLPRLLADQPQARRLYERAVTAIHARWRFEEARDALVETLDNLALES